MSNQEDAPFYIDDRESIGLRVDPSLLKIVKVSDEKADEILENHVELAVDPWSQEFRDFADRHEREQLYLCQVNAATGVIFSLETNEGVWITHTKKVHAKGKLTKAEMDKLREIAAKFGFTR